MEINELRKKLGANSTQSLHNLKSNNPDRFNALVDYVNSPHKNTKLWNKLHEAEVLEELKPLHRKYFIQKLYDVLQ